MGNRRVGRLLGTRAASATRDRRQHTSSLLQLIQRMPAWQHPIAMNIATEREFKHAAKQFLAHYKTVWPEELAGAEDEWETEEEGGEEPQEDKATLLGGGLLQKPMDTKEIAAAVSRAVAEELRKEFQGKDFHVWMKEVGMTGAAGIIEDRVLAKLLPLMQTNLKSMVPMSGKRKGQLTLTQVLEGVADLSYNICGLTVEALSGGLATPLVAAGSGTYKGTFAGLKSKLFGQSTQQKTVASVTTATLEGAQAMVPITGSAWSIMTGGKEVWDALRVKDRLKVLTGQQAYVKSRLETHGDRRVVDLLKRRIDYLATLIDAGTRYAPKSSKLKDLRNALAWLNEQVRKSNKRFGKLEESGKEGLLRDPG